jgi:hypothetical protein
MFEQYLDSWYREQKAYIDQAFWVYYTDISDPQYEKERFVQRWEGFDLDTLRRVLAAGGDDEQCMALYLIAFSRVPQARELLLPYLQSSLVKQRWSSALLLGEMGEEQAVPVLCTMLSEFLPTQDVAWPCGDRTIQDWLELRRSSAIVTLHFWRLPLVTIAMRHALEQLILAEPYSLFDTQQSHWSEDLLAYELGQRAVFGALTGMRINDLRMRLALAAMVVGFYDYTTHPGKHAYAKRIFECIVQDKSNIIRSTLHNLIMTKFGWSEQKAIACLDAYFDDWNARMVELEEVRDQKRREMETQ